MNKSDKLNSLYKKLALNSTEANLFVLKVREERANQKEINTLLDRLRGIKNGGKILDEIINFETKLVPDFKKVLVTLKKIDNEYHAVAGLEDGSEKDLKLADIKKRYEKHFSQAEDLMDAIKIAYIEIKDYSQYEAQLIVAKEPLTYL